MYNEEEFDPVQRVEFEVDPQATITLTLEDDSTIECAVLSTFQASNDRSYIALLPLLDEDETNEDEPEVYLYRYEQVTEDDVQLVNIEDDEEYEIASDAFTDFLNSQEFEMMLGSDDDDDQE